jgi:hypothetical protein
LRGIVGEKGVMTGDNGVIQGIPIPVSHPPTTHAEPHVAHNVGEWEKGARQASPGEWRRELHDRNGKEGERSVTGLRTPGRSGGLTEQKKRGESREQLRRWWIATNDRAGKRGRWADEVRSREEQEKIEKRQVRGGPGLERPSPHRQIVLTNVVFRAPTKSPGFSEQRSVRNSQNHRETVSSKLFLKNSRSNH